MKLVMSLLITVVLTLIGTQIIATPLTDAATDPTTDVVSVTTGAGITTANMTITPRSVPLYPTPHFWKR